jgi:hypothetical protein
VAHDEREWHMVRTGNDRVRVRNQRPLALRGSINGHTGCMGNRLALLEWQSVIHRRRQRIATRDFAIRFVISALLLALVFCESCLHELIQEARPSESGSYLWMSGRP